MISLRIAILGALAVIAILALPVSAHAQATRTWVSGVGDDVNPCSRTAPCKTFASAISKTAAGGEINIIDPGAYGAVTITKSISIIAESFTAGVLATGVTGFTINAATNDRIVLEGIDIEGAGTGLNGVRIIQAGHVTIRRSRIRNFRSPAGSGIIVESALPVSLAVVDSIISRNTFGIRLFQSGAQPATVLVDSVRLIDNVEGIRVAAPGILRLTGSVVAHNTSRGLRIVGAGEIISLGNNVIEGNALDDAPTLVTPLK